LTENKFVFTEGLIDKLEASKKRARYYDLKAPGLMLEVMPSGTKVFRLRRKLNGQAQWATIGNYPAVSLEDARGQSVLLNAELVKGVDFGEERQKSREELTLRQIVDLYFDQYAQGRLRTAKDMRTEINRWFAKEFPLKASQLTTNLLQGRINGLAAEGKLHAANKARNYARAILNWAAKKKLCSNECVGSLDGFKVQSRERFVQPSEFKQLLRAINSHPDERIRDFLLVCLWTGARSGNVKSMRWDQVNLDLGTWTIPLTKNGESQTIALSDAALEVLKERYKTRSTLPWVFPGGNPQNKKPIYNHLTEPKKAWRKIIDAAGIQNLRIHDLRRTAGSFMAISGVNTPTIMKALGHKSMSAAAVYQRVNADPAKRGMDIAVAAMRKYAEGV
jgi:integrase